MRPLTEDETKAVFEKLSRYVGQNLIQLVNRTDEPHFFRLHRERVFYVSEKQLKMAEHIPRKQLMSVGTIIGKFTKTRKFRVQITALDYLARFARYKVWLKAPGEQTFLYGNNVIR
eukprot:Cvel_27767.t1-p1 / transcript=Cvel_27767.t1 / gene=Cvel_27767 / organism=Chromera_velia_CCMP2878 / gene_product=60S ribosome subunit biogenesis protein nip7, putative / transcript_product=60S ribosome subunit biogenesis protein nip7, putative / location=Cvel_scaffold3520:463-3118(-) / protein_length=115 / sequence_SO=supercontig / SO=protein_coding / is_pseudo=false